MLKAIKVQIYPNEEQINYISNLLGCCRFVYNKCLDYKSTSYKQLNKTVSSSDLIKYLVPLKQLFPFLTDVHSKVLQQSVRDLNTAFDNFFKHNAKYPKFKSKHDNKQSCRFPSDAFIGINGNRINLIKALKGIHYKCSVRDEKYLNKNQDKVRSITLTKTKTNKYYLSILIDGDLQKAMKQAHEIIGIDLGIKDFVVTSTGEVFDNLHFKKKDGVKLKRLHKQLSKKEKGSKNMDKARIKLARAYEKVSNRNGHYLHDVVNALLSENQVIVMEDLNVKGMQKNHNLSESIGEVSWGEFKMLLEYKARWYGKEVVFINRFYPSSKRCNHCGYINKGLTLKDRQWVCPECGEVIERDYNAALNIVEEGKRMIRERIGLSSSEYKPVDHPTVDNIGKTALKSRDGKKQEEMVFQ